MASFVLFLYITRSLGDQYNPQRMLHCVFWKLENETVVEQYMPQTTSKEQNARSYYMLKLRIRCTFVQKLFTKRQVALCQIHLVEQTDRSSFITKQVEFEFNQASIILFHFLIPSGREFVFYMGCGTDRGYSARERQTNLSRDKTCRRQCYWNSKTVCSIKTRTPYHHPGLRQHRVEY